MARNKCNLHKVLLLLLLHRASSFSTVSRTSTSSFAPSSSSKRGCRSFHSNAARVQLTSLTAQEDVTQDVLLQSESVTQFTSKGDIESSSAVTPLTTLQSAQSSHWWSTQLEKVGGTELAAMMSLCFLVAIICAVDRVAMSVAILPMAKEYGYSDTTKGLIASAFSWGYMVFMIPAGVLGSFVNPKTVMGMGVLLWSIAQMASPYAASMGLTSLLACRFAMGMSESVTIPTIQEIVSRWVPREQRTRYIALITSGLQVGTVLAYVGSPAIINSFTYNAVFFIYGGLGLLWLTLWVPLARDAPPDKLLAKIIQSDIVSSSSSSSSSAKVNDATDAGSTPNGRKTSSDSPTGIVAAFESLATLPWRSFLTDANLWSIAGAHMAHNWGLYVMLAWLPTYFSEEYGLSLSQSSSASVLPWVVGAVVGNVAGWGADYLINTEVASATQVRRSFQVAALLGPAACMYLLSQGTGGSLNAESAEQLFTTAVAFGSCSCVGFGSSVQDLRSKYTSIIYGLTSAISVVVGSIGTYATGVLLDETHSWSSAFLATAVVYAAGAVWYGTTYKAEARVE